MKNKRDCVKRFAASVIEIWVLVTLSCMLYVAIFIGYDTLVEVYTDATIFILSVLMYVFIGVCPVYSGNSIIMYLGDTVSIVDVSAECSGLLAIAIFMGLVIVTPVELKNKSLSLLFVPVVYAGNVARILMELVIGAYSSVWCMELYHMVVGQVFYGAVLALCYFEFLKLAKSDK